MLSGSIADVLLGSGAFEASNVVLQGAGDVNQQQFDPTTQAGGGFVFTLIVGAIMLAAMPNYVDSVIEDVLEEPFASFAWGILALIAFVGAIVLLAITVVGILLAIPLLFAFVILAIVGNVLAYLAVCDGFVDNRWVALVVAAVAVAVTGLIPVVGGIVSFVVGSVGMGAVVRRWIE